MGAPIVVGVTGVGLIGAGLWGRREVARGLARERIVSTPDAKPPSAPVTTGTAARSMAEVIRRNTIAAAGGRTYAEVEAFVDADGKPTADLEGAALDARTGAPVESPNHAVWIQSMTLQTALTQAYMAERIALMSIAVGVGFLAVAAGLTRSSRPCAVSRPR